MVVTVQVQVTVVAAAATMVAAAAAATAAAAAAAERANLRGVAAAQNLAKMTRQKGLRSDL